MNFNHLKRDAAKVHAALHETPDKRLLCSEEIKIYIPARFIERNLAIVGMQTHILGLFAAVVGNEFYSVCSVCAMMQIEPTLSNRIKIDGSEYLEFVFEAGSTVIKNIELLKVDTITYQIYDTILSSGYVPWYLDYEDMCNIFNSAPYHAGANIGQNREVTQIIVSIIARQKDDRRLSFRHSIKTEQDKRAKKPAWIALNSINYTATNAVSKISGSYQGEGIISAMVNPTDRIERIESILLK